MFVNWTGPARRDLSQIANYIRQDSVTAAQNVSDRIFESVESLTTFPNRGRVGRIRQTRELVLAPLPYIAVYRVFPDEVRVLRVHHTSRNWP